MREAVSLIALLLVLVALWRVWMTEHNRLWVQSEFDREWHEQERLYHH